MRCRIRRIERTKTGSASIVEDLYEGISVGIGRATGQAIQLDDKAVSLEHARLFKPGESEIRIDAIGGSEIFVNGEPVEHAGLKVGDVIKVGRNHLRIARPERGDDLAIEVERASQVTYESIRDRDYVVRLAQGRMSKRRLAWLLAIVAFGLTFLLPWASSLTPDRGAGLNFEPLWSSGPLHGAHGMLVDDCQACHRVPFARVGDAQCATCHGAVPHHVDAGSASVGMLDGERCASCHREHDEPSTLVRRDVAVCTDCHRDLSTRQPGIAAIDVRDFDRSHPEFRASLPDAAGEIRRVRLDQPGLTETSGLKFSHAAHLVPAGVTEPGAGQRVLDCGDCHERRPGDAAMQPVRFEAHCGDCHSLAFDAEAPGRELQHRRAAEVRDELREYYAWRGLQGRSVRPDEGLRRPGRLSEAERRAALDAARARADTVWRDVVGKRACALCHEIVSEPELHVAAVQVPEIWFPKARFSHDDHTAASCGRCHEVRESETAADLLVPGIGLCRDCHGGISHPRLLPTGCIDCHRFHLADFGPMRPLSGAASP